MKATKVFKTTVLGMGPWCVEFPDGEIVTVKTEERAHAIAAAPRMLTALKAILDSGHYNHDGDFIIPHEPWDGQGEPPDTSDPLGIKEAWGAVAEAEGREHHETHEP